MNLTEWLYQTRGDERRQLVIDAVPTSLVYLHQIKGGHRVGSPGFHQRLHAASKEHTPDLVMTLEQLRPDIWGKGNQAESHNNNQTQGKQPNHQKNKTKNTTTP